MVDWLARCRLPALDRRRTLRGCWSAVSSFLPHPPPTGVAGPAYSTAHGARERAVGGPVFPRGRAMRLPWLAARGTVGGAGGDRRAASMLRRRSEEHTSELQSRQYLVCRLLLEKKKKI